MVYTNYKGMGIDVMDDLINARKIINAQTSKIYSFPDFKMENIR